MARKTRKKARKSVAQRKADTAYKKKNKANMEFYRARNKLATLQKKAEIATEHWRKLDDLT